MSALMFPRFYHDGSWTQEELNILARGGVVEKRNRRYRVCGVCLTVVCVDKRLFGSLHVCA